MKTKNSIAIIAALALLATAAHAAVFTTNTTINIGDMTYDGQDIVVSSCTVTVNGPHALNSLALIGGGVVTHSNTTANQEYSLQLTIAGALTVDAASKIDVSGCGYLPGYAQGNTTMGGATGQSSGSYGGLGAVMNGISNPVYGDYRNPNELGTGAGPVNTAGSGGGLVRITANSAQIDGAILANGGSGGFGSGGSGSGGGIRLEVVTLGGSGQLAANGGTATEYGSGGGGGRVAVYYTTLNGFDIARKVTAHGGSGGSSWGGPGSVGTVYLKQTGFLGDLLLANHGASVGLWTPLGTSTNVVFQADNLMISGSNLVVATANGCPIQAASVTITNGAVLTHPVTTTNQEYSLQLTIAGALTVDAASKIDVSGRGYLPGYAQGNTTMGGATGQSSGSYGGLGDVFNGISNPVYGDYRNPNELGTGAGPVNTAGSGGGLVRITANSAQIDGAILANGGSGGFGSGGSGSGGGIRLEVVTLGGSGQLAANGGTATEYGSGGGGGRVAVYYTTLNGFDIARNVTAHGGSGGSSWGGPGSVGTVYLGPSGGLGGEVRIDSHGTTAGVWTPLGLPGQAMADYGTDSITVSGTNVVVVPEHENMPVRANRLSLQTGAVLTHMYSTAIKTYTAEIKVGSLTMDSTSKIDVSGRGYLPGYASGNTTIGGATGQSSGSYGGLGVNLNGTSNPLYGDARDPSEPGAGGGPVNTAGSGGGLVRITANSAQIDGAILANGGSGGFGSGGSGSGGGIRLEVVTLGGSGQLAANGGTSTEYGFGGGGGRIAIYTYNMAGFNTNHISVASGGTGAGSGTLVFGYPQPQPNAEVVGSALRLAWHAGDGSSYQVWSSPDLVNWSLYGPVRTGTGDILTQDCPMTNSPSQFFRVQMGN